MFLFIKILCVTSNRYIYSNTSHVLIYLRNGWLQHLILLYSNTSHVLIYHNHLTTFIIAPLFKYISCSYLSDLAFLVCAKRVEFKYISCSYLSRMEINTHSTPFTFKYISCSYLSLLIRTGWNNRRNSNTSHVLIYLTSFRQFSLHIQHSNTSHVLIYRGRFTEQKEDHVFKYISCSYLSGCRYNYLPIYCAFKYISCSYLSLFSKLPELRSCQFKYISCSYLSNSANVERIILNNSNTSHVLIYPI